MDAPDSGTLALSCPPPARLEGSGAPGGRWCPQWGCASPGGPGGPGWGHSLGVGRHLGLTAPPSPLQLAWAFRAPSQDTPSQARGIPSTLLSHAVDPQDTQDPADSHEDLRLEVPARPFQTPSRNPQGKPIQQSTVASRASPLPTLSQDHGDGWEGQEALLGGQLRPRQSAPGAGWAHGVCSGEGGSGATQGQVCPAGLRAQEGAPGVTAP